MARLLRKTTNIGGAVAVKLIQNISLKDCTDKLIHQQIIRLLQIGKNFLTSIQFLTFEASRHKTYGGVVV
jgi:hypothetical protein